MVSSQALNLRYDKANRVVRKGSVGAYSVAYIILLFISLCAAITVLADTSKPEHYNTLWLLPIAYIIFLILIMPKIESIFTNFGTALLVVLEFVRLVLSPVFLVLANYNEVITLNVAVNTPQAILLMLYETVAIAAVLTLPVRVKRVHTCSGNRYSRGIRRLHTAMAIYTGLLIVFTAISPQVLMAHRTILGVFLDERYTAMQLDKLIVGASDFKRYCLILSRLLLNPYRLLLPAYLIIVIRYKRIKHGKLLSFVLSFFPFLMVNDVIAQSIYFTLFLLLLTVYLYDMGYKKIVMIFSLAAAAVVIYFLSRFFIARMEGGDGFWENMSKKLFTYFSGVNIASGAFNYPTAWAEKGQYFVYEFLRAIPVHNLLGIDESIVPATFFNLNNHVWGQIPTTIGMGYYYFGTALAPILSVITVYLAKLFGAKMKAETVPLYRLTYMFTAFLLALGIVMYNISIAFSTFVQVVLPIYIVAVIAFGHKRTKRYCQRCVAVAGNNR